jgi:hypothetical protein
MGFNSGLKELNWNIFQSNQGWTEKQTERDIKITESIYKYSCKADYNVIARSVKGDKCPDYRPI